MHERRADPEHDRVGDDREQLHEREVHRDEPLSGEPCVEVVAARGPERPDVAVLARVRLSDADTGDALLELGVHGGDALASARVRASGSRSEPSCGHDQRRHDRKYRQHERPAHDRECDEHAEEAHHAHQRVDQAGFEQLGESVDVGRHAGHDAAGHLAVVVVEREPLELGEDPDAQRVEEAFGRAARVQRVHPRVEPVGERDGEERSRGDPERGLGVARHASEALTHQEGPGEREQRVEHHEREADGERAPVGHEEPAQAEAVVGGGLGGAVDAGLVVGGRERVDLGEQLGRGRQHRRRAAAPPHARPTALPGHHRSRLDAGPSAVACRTVAVAAVPEIGGERDDVGLAVEVLLGSRDQRAVPRRCRQQLLVGAVVDHASLVDDHDPAREAQRRAPVRDHHGRAVRHDLAQRRVDLLLGGCVHRRRRVVEHEDARVGEHRARDRDALALTAGQREPTLADDGVVSLGERGDERVRAGDTGSGDDLVVGGVWTPVRDVGTHRVGEQERILEHDADPAA